MSAPDAGQPTEEQVRHDEEQVLRAWREAGPFSTVTLQKFRGRYSHGKIEVNIKPDPDPGGSRQ